MRPFACFLIVLATAGPAMAGQAVSLENDLLRVEWDGQRGGIVSLKDKPTGREWLVLEPGEAAFRPLPVSRP